MNREGAETYLRRLAEAELRRATTAPGDGGLLEECHSARLELVALALHAVHAFDMAAANEIQAGLDLALGLRQPRQGPAGPMPNAQANLAWLMDSARQAQAPRRPPSPRAPWRVVPVGQVIRTRAGDVQGELHLLTYVQTAAGARFTAVSYWGPGQAPDRAPAAASRRGARRPVHRGRRPGHQLSVRRQHRTRPHRVVRRARPGPEPAAGDPLARPQHASGEPATRIDLTPPPAAARRRSP